MSSKLLLPRRDFLKFSSVAALAAGLGPLSAALAQSVSRSEAKADYTLRIAVGLVELAPEHIVATTLYNDQFPGPLLRLKEGQGVTVEAYNETDTPELVRWHGQMIPSDVDGASEEGTPFVPAHSMRRIAFVPKPSGFRFYHTHVPAGGGLNRGTYTGQAGPLYIEPKNNPGAYDREVFLVMKEFEPTLSRGVDMAMDFLAGDPIRVKQGERVLFHVLSASAGEIRSLALPGHVFRVVALDGNPVPTPADVPVLWLGTAERISGRSVATPTGSRWVGSQRRHRLLVSVANPFSARDVHTRAA